MKFLSLITYFLSAYQLPTSSRSSSDTCDCAGILPVPFSSISSISSAVYLSPIVSKAGPDWPVKSPPWHEAQLLLYTSSPAAVSTVSPSGLALSSAPSSPPPHARSEERRVGKGGILRYDSA